MNLLGKSSMADVKAELPNKVTKYKVLSSFYPLGELCGSWRLSGFSFFR